MLPAACLLIMHARKAGFAVVVEPRFGAERKLYPAVLKNYRIVDDYTVVLLLRPPDLLRCEPFFGRREVCKTQGKRCLHHGVAIVHHCAIVNLLRVAN